MADSVFVARRLVCIRAPGACRVNASEIRDEVQREENQGYHFMSNTFSAEPARVALSMAINNKGQSNAVLLVWWVRALNRLSSPCIALCRWL